MRFLETFQVAPASLGSGPSDPSSRALSGRLKFTVRHHAFKKDSLSDGRKVGSRHPTEPMLLSGDQIDRIWLLISKGFCAPTPAFTLPTRSHGNIFDLNQPELICFR